MEVITDVYLYIRTSVSHLRNLISLTSSGAETPSIHPLTVLPASYKSVIFHGHPAHRWDEVIAKHSMTMYSTNSNIAASHKSTHIR